MAIYRRAFIIENVVPVHRAFLSTIAAAERNDLLLRSAGQAGLGPALAELRRAYLDFQAGLDRVAIRGSASARLRIQEVLQATAVRPDGGNGVHLKDRIVCRPLNPIAGFATGGVGVADESALDRAGGAVYWRSQEFGTGTSEVGSITTAATGRLLRGYFYDRGFRNPVSPDQTLFREHPLFKPGPYIKGQPYRIGRVRREIQGRHFIAKGSALAEAEWRASLAALQTDTLAELGRVAARALGAGAP